MGDIGEEPAVSSEQLNGNSREQNVGAEEHSRNEENGEVKENKKSSDAILDELFSSIQQSGTIVDVAEAITEDSKSRRERATRDRSRSRSRDRKHKHKKSKKEKKHKRHRSRSRSNDRKKRHRSSSSSPCHIGKTGTLADIKINTKSKNLDDLKNAVPFTSPPINIHHEDDDDDLPVGADYRTVMAEAVANSEPSTSHEGPSLSDLPTARKMQPAFPLKKSDGEKGERKDPIEDKSNPMLKKVISEKGGALLIPRKIQIEASKNNGSTTSDSFGPAPPPYVKEEVKGEEEEEMEINSGTIKAPPKITFGQISLKVNAGAEKKIDGNGEVKKENEHGKMKVDENEEEKIEKVKEKKKEKEDEKEEKNDDKEKKAAKKMAVRRRRSSSVEDSKRKKEKERKRSRSKERKGDDRSRDRSRDHRRDRSRSKDRRDRKDDKSRRRSRSGDRRRDDRDRERDRRSGRRSRSRDRRSSRERERERERSRSREKIDKKKLLEIALQNSRGVSGPVAEKQGVNMKILEKAGGRNIGDIVSYCQKLSETEKDEKVGGHDSDDDDFSYKNKKEIKMNIPGSKQLPTCTPQERLLDTAPLRAAFPVSSGVIHRDNTKDQSMSEWKKVDASAVPSVCTPAQKKLIATTSLSKAKAESEGKVVPLPSFPILPPPPAPPKLRGDLIPPPPPPPVFSSTPLMPPPPMPPTIITPSYDRLIQMPDSGYDEVRE